MMKISSMALIAFIFSFSSLQASTNGDEIQAIERETKRIAQYVIAQAVQEEAILIIGDTGEGKSSLLNFLAGREFVAQEEKGNFGELVLQCKNPLTAIAGGIISRTIDPVHWGAYWDCPGFYDSRGPAQDIINAFTLDTLIKNSKRVKFLVTVSENTLRGIRKQRFLTLLRHLGNFMEDTENLTRGLCLVVTRNKELNLGHMREGMASMLREAGSDKVLNTSQRKILEHLSSPNSRIAFFKAPKKPGMIVGEERVDMGNTIEAELKKTVYIERPKVQITVADGSKIYVRELASRSGADLTHFVSTHFYEGLEAHFHHLIDNHRGPVRELRGNLVGLSKRLKEISGKEKDFAAKLKHLQEIAEKDLRGKFLQEFQHFWHWFNFLRDFKELAGLAHITSTDAWYRLMLTKAREDIRVLTSPPEKDKHGKTLSLRGLLVGMQDLVDETAMEPDISELSVYSLNTLFIDANIHKPGVNMALVSPRWRIIDRRIINLRGRNGQAHANLEGKDEEARAKNGVPGLPGLPGMSGGRLYARGIDFYELSNLTVDVSGGTGGKGQDGVKGTPGKNGNDGGLQDVQAKRENIYFFSRKKADTSWLEKGAKFLLTFNDKFMETYESYEPGTPGGDSGRGGIGGLGGHPGTVVIKDPASPSERRICVDGGKGPDGKAGIPGAGGRGGPIYRGVYVNEIVCPTVRGYNESPDFGVVSSVTGAGLGTLASEVGGEAVREGVRGILTSAGIAVRGMRLASAGLGVLAQTVASPLSAYISSGWLEKPHKTVRYGPFAPSGSSPTSLNEEGRQSPKDTPPIDEMEKVSVSSYMRFEAQNSDSEHSKKFIRKFDKIRSSL